MVIRALSEVKKVWNVTKKPSKKEYFTTFRIVLIGFVVIGLIGFVVELLWHLVLKHLFI